MKKTMMKLLSVVMALMMLFGCCSTLVSATAHTHDKMTKLETIAPRCNAYGYTLYTCSCGETWATDIVAKTEGVHSLEVDGTYVDVPAVAPSCEAEGKKAAKACSWCGATLEGGEKSGDKLNHNWQYVLVEGDCTSDAKIVYKCTNEGCDKAPTETINLGSHEVNGHNFVYNITKYPQCKLEAVSGALLSRVIDGVLVSGYNLVKTKGEAEYECLDCGVKYTGIVVEWNDHTVAVKNNGKKDTCTDFYAEWTECLECGLATGYAKTDLIAGHDMQVVANATCTTDGSKKCSRTDCTATEVIPATGHTYTYTCTAGCVGVCHDCTHEGRKIDCTVTGCALEPADAKHTEHAWGTKQYYAYYSYGEEKIAEYDGTSKFCTPISLYVYCTNEECNERKLTASVAADVTAGHIKLSYVAGSTPFAADCISDGYIMVNCLACLQSNIKLVGADAKAFVESNLADLKAAIEADDFASADEKSRTQAQLAIFESLNTVDFLALGHITDASQVKVVAGTKATCTTTGTTDKHICNRGGTCTYVVLESTETAKDANNHKNTAGTSLLSQIGDIIPGTCTTPNTKYMKCSGCEHIVYEKGDYNYFNHTKYSIDENTFKMITSQTITGDAALIATAAVAEKCGEADGNKAYKTCKFCMNVVSVDGVNEQDKDSDGKRDAKDSDTDTDVDVIFTLADAIIDKAHKFTTVAAVKETCTTNGHNEYQEPCTRCGAISPVTKKIIPAHGTKFTVVVDTEARPATCVIPGVAAGVYCAECNTKDGATIASGSSTLDWAFVAEPDFDNTTNKDPWYIAPLGHAASASHMKVVGAAELAKVTVLKGDCRAESFAVRFCEYCVAPADYDPLNAILLGMSDAEGKKVPADAWVISKLVEAVDHSFPEAVYETDATKGLVKNVTDNFTGNAAFDACVMDKEYYVTCDHAGCTATKLVKTEAAKGHYYIDNGTEVVINVTCTEIEKYADWTCVACNGIVGQTIVPKHSIVEVIEQPGCEANATGKKFWACELCDAHYFADNQNPYATPSNNEALYVTTLYSTGHDFIEFATENGKLTEKYFKPATYTEDGYVYRVCSKCGIVKQTLSKLTPVLDITLKADKTTVASGDVFQIDITYTGEYVKFNAMQIDLAYASDLVTFLKDDFNQELPAGVAVKEENNGKIIVSVYSLDGIEPTETQTISLFFRANTNFDKTAVLAITDAAVFNAKGEDITYDEVRFSTQASVMQIKSVVTGELNGFAGINAGDAIVMMDLIYAKQYNAQADLNKDGNVDVADFAILNKLIATDGSADAYNKVIKDQVAKYGFTYTLS